ncbi:MAG: hypothetical protein PHT12_04995 [Patescibacteria group bacterium]|nr:hypothetical protein [Patescibacteria group bacterium]
MKNDQKAAKKPAHLDSFLDGLRHARKSPLAALIANLGTPGQRRAAVTALVGEEAGHGRDSETYELYDTLIRLILADTLDRVVTCSERLSERKARQEQAAFEEIHCLVATEAMTVWQQLPREWDLLETRAYVLDGVVTRYCETKDEREADRLLAFLSGLDGTREVLKVVEQSLRELTEKAPYPRLLRALGQIGQSAKQPSATGPFRGHDLLCLFMHGWIRRTSLETLAGWAGTIAAALPESMAAEGTQPLGC